MSVIIPVERFARAYFQRTGKVLEVWNEVDQEVVTYLPDVTTDAEMDRIVNQMLKRA